MSNGITIVKPFEVKDAMLISTDVPEADHAAWASGTTYALGARIIVVADHAIYESVQANNLNKPPATSPAWWIKVGATNRWKAFDTSNSTQTVTAGGATPKITYVLRPGAAVGCVALLNVLDATSVRITLTDPVYGVVYDKTNDMAAVPQESSWWAWFFGRRTRKAQHVAIDLPAFPNADLTVELTGSSTMAVGVIMFGQAVSFGRAVTLGVRVGIKTYSTKTTNEWGDTVFRKGKVAKRQSLPLFLNNSDIDPMLAYMAEIDSTPVLFIGSQLYESTTVFGFYEDFDILVQYAQYSDCDINIQGLT
jgi:hypothetical protein